MRASLPCHVGLVLVVLSGVLAQDDDTLNGLLSIGLDVATAVGSALTATSASTATSSSSRSITNESPSTSTSAQSSSDSASSSAASSSTFATSSATQPTASRTSSEPASQSTEAAAAGSDDSKNKTLAIALGVSLAVLALAILIGFFFCCWRRRRRQRRGKLAQSSKRSLSPDVAGSAKWQKEPIARSSTVGKNSPRRTSTPDRAHVSHGSYSTPMTENVLNTPGGSRGLPASGAPVSHGESTNIPSGIANGTAGSQGLYDHQQSKHDSLDPHSSSKSTAIAAGVGGAALGGMAAKHHNDKHHSQNSSDLHRGISRKPVGGTSSSVVDGNSRSRRGSLGNSSGGVGTHSSSSVGTAGPPPYNNSSSNPLTSHPLFGDAHRHSTGHETSASRAAEGVTGGNSNDVNRKSDPHVEDRNTFRPNGQHQHPPSILANVAGRRATGSSNPYVSARSPARTRFSDNVDIAEMPAHRGHEKHNNIEQGGADRGLNQHERPRIMNSGTDRRFSSGGGPSHAPGSWRGSCDWDQKNRHEVSSNEDDEAEARQRSASFGDVSQQKEGDWYRDRKTSGSAEHPGFPSRPPYDSRFYQVKGVGTAI